MFSNKTKETAPPAPTAPVPQAKRNPVRSSAPSLISADLVVQGTLSSSGDVQIDGRVEGDVHSAGLVIGEKAHLEGEIFAEDVTIRGHVQGSVRARKVLLCSTCHVEGDILHEAFAVEAGAFFEGNCRHSDNPLEGGHRRNMAHERTAAANGATEGAPAVSAPPAAASMPKTAA